MNLYELGIYGLIGQEVYIKGMYVIWILTSPQTFVCHLVYSIEFWIQPMVRWSSRVVVFVSLLVRSLDGDCIASSLPLCSLKGIFKVWWHSKISLLVSVILYFLTSPVFYKHCIEIGCRTVSFVFVQHEEV